MNIKIYEKPIPTKFIEVDGIEFELGELHCALEQMLRTKENDTFGDYSLRDYELHCEYETMEKLVKMELVKNYTGSRMADLYCMKNKSKIEEIMEKIYEMDV